MRKTWLPGGAFVLAAAFIITLGCGAGSTVSSPPRFNPTPLSTSPPPTAPPPGINVTVAPPGGGGGPLDAGQSQPFTATVANDPNHRGVTWTVINGATNATCAPSVCGVMAGSSSASGAPDKYTAPSVTAGVGVTLKATSVSDPNQAGYSSLYVSPKFVRLAAPPLAGNVGQGFSVDLSQYVQGGSGGNPIWSIKSGTLPAGLALNYALLSGTFAGPPATVAIVFTARDSSLFPVSLDVPISLTINPPLPISISPSSGGLPNGVIGARYNQIRHCRSHVPNYCWFVYGVQINATGGVKPYSFSWGGAPGSSVPAGLNLTGRGGLEEIDGTPTTAGTYNVVVTVTDSYSPALHASASYTITVTR